MCSEAIVTGEESRHGGPILGKDTPGFSPYPCSPVLVLESLRVVLCVPFLQHSNSWVQHTGPIWPDSLLGMQCQLLLPPNMPGTCLKLSQLPGMV